MKTMKNVLLHLKLIRGMRGNLLAYVVQLHIKVSHFLFGYGAYLNIDKEMTARASIINSKLNLNMLKKPWIEPISVIKLIHS